MGFSPSTTNNELQIIMIMKISNDINKIGLTVLGMSIWPMFLHLHLSKRGCFFLAPHLCQTSADWAVCLSIWRILFIFIAPHFPSLILSFNQSSFFLCDFLFHSFYLGSFSYTSLSHIDNRLMSVSSCAEKSHKVHLMNSWCKARSDLFKSAGLDLRCQAS